MRTAKVPAVQNETEAAMVEYVIVKFPDRRVVLIDGDSQGYNKKKDGEDLIKRIDRGRYNFSLKGKKNFTPGEQWVDVKNTDSIAPLKVVFKKKLTDE